MTLQISTLANGMRVVSHAMPHLQTVSLGVWVASGARHETESEHGISHLLEHMAFKGTTRRTAVDIAEEIEQVGGDLNAATSLDTTCYYARVLKDDVTVALDIIADILQNPRYANEDLERERDVIIQEIASTLDSPEEMVFDLVQDAAFEKQPLGRPILGTVESVSRFTPAELRTFLAARYKAEGMVLSAAGNVSHDALVAQAQRLFADIPGGKAPPAVAARYVGGSRVSQKSFEQAHIVLGYEGFPYRDPDFFAVQVFSGLFGGGMSSRLFQEVREKRGLCYSIYSSAWGVSDTGFVSVNAATGPEMAGQLVDVVRTELAKVAGDLVSEAELRRSKAQLKAGLLMSLESSSGRAEQMARQLIAHDRVVPTDELIAKVEAVDREAVRATVERLLTGSKPSFALVGARKGAQAIAARAVSAIAG
ncbi:MAG: pitrilysin family protein [Hyphomicrobiaceae bacterium]